MLVNVCIRARAELGSVITVWAMSLWYRAMWISVYMPGEQRQRSPKEKIQTLSPTELVVWPSHFGYIEGSLPNTKRPKDMKISPWSVTTALRYAQPELCVQLLSQHDYQWHWFIGSKIPGCFMCFRYDHKYDIYAILYVMRASGYNKGSLWLNV